MRPPGGRGGGEFRGRNYHGVRSGGGYGGSSGRSGGRGRERDRGRGGRRKRRVSHGGGTVGETNVIVEPHGYLSIYSENRVSIQATAFVILNNIDTIAGRHATKDPRQRATFKALIAQLDGEMENTGVDRSSLRQAVFISATTRPNELDLESVRRGHIDRRMCIGLPDAKQTVQIYGVHNTGNEDLEDHLLKPQTRTFVMIL